MQDFDKEIKLIVNEGKSNFDTLRSKKLKYFRQEDLNFAKYL